MTQLMPEVNAVAARRPLASLGRRLVGQIIDWVIAIGIFLLAIPLEAVNETLIVVPMFGAVMYYLFCDGLPNGQSLTKRWLGMSVIGSDSGQPCSYGQSLLRNITQPLGILDWLWIFGTRQRRAGDLLAHTVVVAV